MARNEFPDRQPLLRQSARRERLRASTNNTKLNNPQTIIELENEPAYLRRGVKLDAVQHSSEHQNSNWAMDENNELRTNGNSFLHDNVD